MWAAVLLALAYGSALLYLGALTSSNTLDGSIGVLLGVYICSHPAAYLLNLLYLTHGARQQLLSRPSGVMWLEVQMLVLLFGLTVIVIGANRFVQPA